MSLLKFERAGGRERQANAKPLLSVESIIVRNGPRLVLDNVDLTVYEGERIRIAGPNGSGKSTLFNAIAGITPVLGGRIIFRGRNLDGIPAHERARAGIHYMRQRDNVFSALTVEENLRLALGRDGYQVFMSRYPEWASDLAPDVTAGMLSGGQKQKLAWAMIGRGSRQLAMLDEPLAGVAESLDFADLGSITILWVSHE